MLLYAKNVTFQWCGVAMECTLRAETYAKLLELDGETLSRYNVGELLTTMNRDTISFKELYSRMILNIFDSVIVIVFSVVTLTMLDWRLLFLPVAVAPFFTVALVRYLRQAKVLFKEIRESYSAINLTVQENIDAVRIVRSFAGEETEMHKFDRDNERVYALNKQEARLSAKYNSIFTLCQQVGYVGTVCIAFALVLSGSIALGALTAATTYVTKIISHIMQISRSFYMMQNQLVSGARLKKFLTEEGAIHDSRALRTAPQKPHFRFEDVSLTLGEKPVLKHITLDLPYGKKLGVMGGTGSGKSVLLKSLSRIYDVTAGDITLDGTDIRDYSLEALRSEFAYVFQDVFLFSNTVDANIAFAHPDVPKRKSCAPRRSRRPTSSSASSRRATRQWWASAAWGFRAGRSSASPSRGRSSRARPSSSSTTLPRRSTWRRSAACSPPSRNTAPTARSSSPHTASPPSSTATRSSISATARSSNGARPRNSSQRTARSRRSIICRRATDSSTILRTGGRNCEAQHLFHG